MSNRFDRPYGQEYVSQYVKPPLDYISGMAKDYTSKYNKLEEESYGLNDLMASVKSIDEHTQFKKALDAKYQPKLNELADKIAKGNDLVQTKRDLNKLNREWVNDPLRIELENSVANRALEQKEKIKLGAKYQKYNDPNIGFKGITETGDIQPLRFSGIPEAQDYQKRASELVDKIASDSYDSQNDILGSDGIIIDRRTGEESVSSKKVRDIANTLVPNFATTLEGQDYIRMIKSQNPNLSNEQLGQHLSDYLYNTAAKQIGSKAMNATNIDVTSLASDIRKEESVKQGLVGQVVPGNIQYKLTKDLPSNIKDRVVIDDSGNVKVNYDVNTTDSKYKVVNSNGTVSYHSNSEEAHKAAGSTGSITQTKATEISNKDRADLYNYVQKASKAIGFKGNVNTDNYNEILTKYNKASKAISYDYKLPDIEQAVIKDDMITDKKNYKFMDAKGKIIDPSLLDATFNPDTRVYDNGKSKISFSYTDKNNSTDPNNWETKYGTAENLAYEDSKFHNTVANLQTDQLNFYKEGEIVNKSAEKLNRDFKSKNLTFDPNNPNLKAISVTQSPTNNKMYVVLADPDNRKEQTYQVWGKNPDGSPYRYNIDNLPQLMKDVNADWYETNEGKAELTRLQSNSEKYKTAAK
jgi:hypothetical protein